MSGIEWSAIFTVMWNCVTLNAVELYGMEWNCVAPSGVELCDVWHGVELCGMDVEQNYVALCGMGYNYVNGVALYGTMWNKIVRHGI